MSPASEAAAGGGGEGGGGPPGRARRRRRRVGFNVQLFPFAQCPMGGAAASEWDPKSDQRMGDQEGWEGWVWANCKVSL